MAGVPVTNLFPLRSEIHSWPCFVVLELDCVDLSLLPAGTVPDFVLLQHVWGVERTPWPRRDCEEQIKISQIKHQKIFSGSRPLGRGEIHSWTERLVRNRNIASDGLAAAWHSHKSSQGFGPLVCSSLPLQPVFHGQDLPDRRLLFLMLNTLHFPHYFTFAHSIATAWNTVFRSLMPWQIPICLSRGCLGIMKQINNGERSLPRLCFLQLHSSPFHIPSRLSRFHAVCYLRLIECLCSSFPLRNLMLWFSLRSPEPSRQPGTYHVNWTD